jgi:predicted metal-dependent TIM-barrel fold hydrolase
MKIFDAQIRSDTRTDDELRNLHYFETERVVTTAHARRDFERADDLLAYFDELLTSETARLRRCGLVPYVGLGVLPDARPRRAHYEVWRELPFLLQEDHVVAVGEIGAWEDERDHWELFDRQVKTALQAGLPMIITPPPNLKVNMTYKMMHRLERLGATPSMCLMNHLDERLVTTVVSEGFLAGIAVGYQHIEPRAAANMIAEALDTEESEDNIILSSSLQRGAADILGIPKTVVSLREAGVSTETIERVAYGNAMRVFVTNAS